MRCLLALSLLAVATGAASAQNVSDPERGYFLATLICSDCHAIEPNDRVSPNGAAPTFQGVANTSGISEIALTVFFQTPHATMPNIVLPTGDRRDLSAYILSLKD